MPGLRVLRLCSPSSPNITVRVSVCRAPRLHWMMLEGFSRLQEVTLDCPELLWLGVFESAPVRLVRRCRCPLMGCGEADLASDGTLREQPTPPTPP